MKITKEMVEVGNVFKDDFKIRKVTKISERRVEYQWNYLRINNSDPESFPYKGNTLFDRFLSILNVYYSWGEILSTPEVSS